MSDILGFACDPGGANILRALTAPLKTAGYSVALWGKEKALDILPAPHRNIADIISQTTLETIHHFLQREPPRLVLTGTSGDDFTERFLWKAAQTLEIPSIAVLDQWVNYGLRFSPFRLSQREHYQKSPDWPYQPDKICVMDSLAKKEMVKEGLPAERIVITGQPHLEAIGAQLQTLNREAIRTELHVHTHERLFLFVSEPFDQAYGGDSVLGFTEKTVFEELLDALQALEHLISDRITLAVKPHPRENPQYFEDQLQSRSFQRIQLRLTNRAPSDLLVAADLVIGMASMMLVEAALVEKPILCLQIGGRGKVNPLVLCRSGQLHPIQTRDQLYLALPPILGGDLPPGTRFNPTEPAANSILKVIQECLDRHERN